jgi:hypothetical protein
MLNAGRLSPPFQIVVPYFVKFSDARLLIRQVILGEAALMPLPGSPTGIHARG